MCSVDVESISGSATDYVMTADCRHANSRGGIAPSECNLFSSVSLQGYLLFKLVVGGVVVQL